MSVDNLLGKPTGWEPKCEADHWIKCPRCGDWFDCRDLPQVIRHSLEDHEADLMQ